LKLRSYFEIRTEVVYTRYYNLYSDEKFVKGKSNQFEA
jgi:hypothetical protein